MHRLGSRHLQGGARRRPGGLTNRSSVGLAGVERSVAYSHPAHTMNLLSAHRTVDFPEYPLRWLELATGCPLGARLAERGRTRTFMRFAPAIGW